MAPPCYICPAMPVNHLTKSIIIIANCFMAFSCSPMQNFNQPENTDHKGGQYLKMKDDTSLFVYDYLLREDYRSTLFIISGITGINHHREKDIIEALSGGKNRIVIIHPRGTGYSEGKRGDIDDFELFLNDYREIISRDRDYQSKKQPVFLFGHSMSTAVLLAVADSLSNISGAILVNPPYIQKKVKGMSPNLGQYLKYAAYMLFAPHRPVVNMAGDPPKMENEEDRKEALQRSNDSLLVKYFSMYYMKESGKLLKSIPSFAERADYPLLLIYGLKDDLVDQKGCDIIFESWKHPDKKYLLIEKGSHGKSTVMEAKGQINKWVNDQTAPSSN